MTGSADREREGEPSDLLRKIRGLRWLVFWAFLLGTGMGFYAGFTLGVSTAKTAHEIGVRR